MIEDRTIRKGETLRKKIKVTGNALAITFHKEEAECYRLKKGQVLIIKIVEVIDE